MIEREFNNEFKPKYMFFFPKISDNRLNIITYEHWSLIRDSNISLNVLRGVLLIIREDYDFWPKGKVFKGLCLAKQYPDTYTPDLASDEVVQTDSNKKARREFYETVAKAYDSHVESSNKLFGQCGFSHLMIGLGEEIILEPVKRQKGYEERERRRAETIRKVDE